MLGVVCYVLCCVRFMLTSSCFFLCLSICARSSTSSVSYERFVEASCPLKQCVLVNPGGQTKSSERKQRGCSKIAVLAEIIHENKKKTQKKVTKDQMI